MRMNKYEDLSIKRNIDELDREQHLRRLARGDGPLPGVG